jgi:hypothetical protein
LEFSRIAVTTIAALRRIAAGEAKIWSNLCDEEGFPFGRLQNAMSIAEFLSDITKFFFKKHWNLVEILSFCHNRHRQQTADALASAFCTHSLSVTKPPS